MKGSLFVASLALMAACGGQSASTLENDAGQASRDDAGNSTDAGNAMDAGNATDAGNLTDAGTSTIPEGGGTGSSGTCLAAGGVCVITNTPCPAGTAPDGYRPDQSGCNAEPGEIRCRPVPSEAGATTACEAANPQNFCAPGDFVDPCPQRPGYHDDPSATASCGPGTARCCTPDPFKCCHAGLPDTWPTCQGACTCPSGYSEGSVDAGCD